MGPNPARLERGPHAAWDHPCDVRAHEQALEGDARSSKGLSAAFLTVENGNDAHDVAVGFSTQTRHGLDR